jgi:predicted transcriptional regulator
MTTETISAPVALPPDAIVIPTHNPEGRSLTAQERFRDHALRNPTFVRDFATPGTPAAALKAQLDREMLAEAGTVVPPEVKPEHYRLPWNTTDGLSDEQQAFDGMARSWLSAAGLDGPTGTSVALQLVERADWWRANPGEWETSADAGRKVLEGIFGKEADAVIKTADAYVARIEQKSPGLKAWLAETNLANDPQVITRFYWLARSAS